MEESEPKEKKKEDVVGSETVMEMIKRKTPWVMGSVARKPNIKFPSVKRRRVAQRVTKMSTKAIVVLAIYIILFVLQTGVVYLAYRETPAVGQDSNGEALFLYPSTQEAFINESIVASILMIFSSAGFLMLYKASQHLYDKRVARRYIIIGLLIILGTFFGLQAMIQIKSGAELFNI
ncbi:MAG: hypothetical protein JW891_15545 [Candidatus Lokiarchaeota archaeon]|nr:hypothetical protein [Candidatus Lokiarchaeota archaeon]